MGERERGGGWRERERERERGAGGGGGGGEIEHLPQCLLDEPEHVDDPCLSLWVLFSQAEQVDHPEPNVVA